MSNFKSKEFTMNHKDQWMTPPTAWQNILHWIPKDKVIWEPFWGNGKIVDFWKGKGFHVVGGADEDFFKTEAKGDIILTNPPFSIKEKVINRLLKMGKPFIAICPAWMLHTQYFRKIMKGQVQIIIPKSRINFHPSKTTPCKTRCNFECYYYCYKMGLPSDLNWID